MIGSVSLFGIADVGWTVVDDGHKLTQVVAGNASIGLSLQFPP